MKLDSEVRINILTVATALVVAFVRHSLDSNRVPWDGAGPVLISWFIHTIALFVVILVASFAIQRWHRTFLGEDRDLLATRVEFQYYITTTLLVTAIAIFIVKAAGPFSEAEDF